MKVAIQHALDGPNAETVGLLTSWIDAPSFMGGMGPWPTELRTLTGVMFSAKQPMFVAWGPERFMLYNDAYAAILGERHPAAFGKRFAEVWADILPVVGPILDGAYGGTPTHMDDLTLFILRDGRPQEAHFSFSYTPVRSEDGAVLGVFCACSETTSVVMAEQLRMAEEERRLKLFQSAPGFIAILRSPEHVFEFANDAYHRLTGNRPLIGRKVREAFPEVASQGFNELLDQVYRTGQRHVAHGMPIKLQLAADKPLQERFLDFVYEPITDAHGEVIGIFVEGADVTEALLTQRELRASHARYKELLDSMHEGFVLLDEAFRVVEINAAGLRIDGRSADHILGRPHWEVWPASADSPVEAAYRRVMDERVPVALQHHYVSETLDVCLLIRAYPVKGGIAVLYSDVTRTMTAQKALEHSDQRFRAAVAAIGVLWTNDSHGRMTGEQPGWSELTGQSEAEYSGEGWARAVHPDDAQASVDAWRKAVAERRTYIDEHRVRRRDGQWRRFAVRAVPVTEVDGHIREWVGVHIDITDAATATEALREADRRKDAFLATLAHELRNPLAPIRTAAHLLSRPNLPPDRIAWCSDLIRRQSQTMALLLDDLLEVSRITCGRLELKKTAVSLKSIVDSAVETARPLIDAKRHQLDVVLPEPALLLEVDPLRVSQMLTNLLGNAAKYTEQGGHIQLIARLSKDEVSFDVADNGPGIAPEMLTSVFEMFQQARDTLDRSEGGLGIGLALSKGLAELHGGRIEAFSEGLGQGSLFRVTLPLAAVQAAGSAGQSANPQPTDASRVRHRVLVADDNVDAASTLAMVLELEDCEVHIAHDGLQALALAARVRPDTAFLDIGMPGMDGYHLATRLRSEAWGGNLFLVATTGWGQDEDRRKAMAAGFDHHLTKPVNPEEVTALLRAHGQGRSVSA